MEQQISIERLYTLGDYKNLKVIDVISGIPEKLMLDDSFQNQMRLLMMIRADKTNVKYRMLTEGYKSLSIEEAYEILEKLEEDANKSIIEILLNGKLETRVELENVPQN